MTVSQLCDALQSRGVIVTSPTNIKIATPNVAKLHNLVQVLKEQLQEGLTLEEFLKIVKKSKPIVDVIAIEHPQLKNQFDAFVKQIKKIKTSEQKKIKTQPKLSQKNKRVVKSKREKLKKLWENFVEDVNVHKQEVGFSFDKASSYLNSTAKFSCKKFMKYFDEFVEELESSEVDQKTYNEIKKLCNASL